MSKIIPVIKREYLTRVKTKSFIFTTLFIPVALIILTAAPAALMLLKAQKQKQVAVVDLTGNIYEPLVQAVDDTTKGGKRLYQFKKVKATIYDLARVKESLSKEVDENRIDTYIIIPADVFANNTAELYAKNVSNFDENKKFEHAISLVVTHIRLDQRGLDPKEVNQLVRKVKLETFKIKAGGKEEKDVGFTFGITYFLTFFLYMALIVYGASVMRSVAEEKTSRVVEMVVSSVKPFQLMAGKILGVGAVGFTQFSIWAVVVGLASIYGVSAIKQIVGGGGDFPLPSIPPIVLICFVLFFILGYFFYSTMYAGVGAMVGSEQEANQLQLPVTAMLIIPFMMMFYVINNPDTGLAVALSLIPFFSPIIMMVRVSVQTPPLYQILTSIAILLISIWGMIWLVGRIYRVGILMYGKRPTLPELMKWIRYG